MAYPASPERLTPVFLGSRTPAFNEKVLNFLDGMERAGDDVHRPAPPSLVDPDEHQSHVGSERNVHSPRSQASRRVLSPPPKGKNSQGTLEELAGSAMTWEQPRSPPKSVKDDDADSNAQEGRTSELDHDIQHVHEPGPEDHPGPHYESYSSFGNKGPLPVDDPPFLQSQFNPEWDKFQHHEAKSPPWAPEHQLSPLTQAINVSLPLSVEPSRVASPITERARSRGAGTAGKGRSVASPTVDRAQAASPMSSRSRADQPAPGETRYRESPTGLPSPISSNLGSPRPHSHHNRAPSISPSDSPSQIHVHRAKSPAKSHRPAASASGLRSPPPTSVVSGSRTQQGMAFAPYRNAPTNEDLLYAAARDRAILIPDEGGYSTPKAGSVAGGGPPSPSKDRSAKGTSIASNVGRAPNLPQSPQKSSKAPSIVSKAPSKQSVPPQPSSMHPSRVQSPASMDLNAEEEKIVHQFLAPSRTPRTSYYAGSTLEPEVVNSHFHDMELCLLLHQLDDSVTHEVVKRVLRKAVRQRVKKLGLKYDTESIKQYQRDHSHHDPTSHLPSEGLSDEPPQWAADIKRELVLVQQRIESLGETVGSKIETLLPGVSHSVPAESTSDHNDYESRTPTQTVNIQTQPGTMADSMYHPVETDILEDPDQNDFYNAAEHADSAPARSDYDSRPSHLKDPSREGSPGEQFLEEQLFKLRQKPRHGSESGRSHRTWEVTRSNHLDDDEDSVGGGHDELPEDEGDPGERVPTISGLPTIPDTGNTATDHRTASPPLPPIPAEERSLMPQPQWTGDDEQQPPPWQKIHQRLLSWAMIWPLSELETALNSTTRGHQVDEVALSIWSTQTYKRYVRARLTDRPAGVVDRLFVPPNMADAISNAVFNGRHGVACGMLRSLWAPFGLEGMPRLLIVLAKHRNDDNHWVVHRFSLPDGGLTTYDSYPERTLPDGRPLGWWFAIRVAWPDAIYPSPDHLMQKMVRLHRPTQLPIDNSVAAAGIWRNLLMGSRAERSLDLERLRDLINTEVKNLRQRKQLGKLVVGGTRPEEEIMFA